jgi:nucleoside-diphosphate-sugar epimerase
MTVLNTTFSMRTVFVSSGTGYVGTPLVEEMVARGHRVRVLARAEIEYKVTRGAVATLGNALDASTFVASIAPADTFVHLTARLIPHRGRSASSVLSIFRACEPPPKRLDRRASRTSSTSA